MSATVEPKPLRCDAARNRERVIAAALEVFAERGLEATMPEVAARAGVGKATVYRSFATRDDLVASIVLERLAWYRTEAERALDAPEAWPAFVALMLAAADLQACDRAFAAALAATSARPDVVAARAQSAVALDALMTRAQAQGGMRPGPTAADVRVLFGGVARVLAEDDERDPVAWRRATGLILDALRAEGTAALPLD